MASEDYNLCCGLDPRISGYICGGISIVEIIILYFLAEYFIFEPIEYSNFILFGEFQINHQIYAKNDENAIL